jgi:hypothetical protein
MMATSKKAMGAVKSFAGKAVNVVGSRVMGVIGIILEPTEMGDAELPPRYPAYPYSPPEEPLIEPENPCP